MRGMIVMLDDMQKRQLADHQKMVWDADDAGEKGLLVAQVLEDAMIVAFLPHRYAKRLQKVLYDWQEDIEKQKGEPPL